MDAEAFALPKSNRSGKAKLNRAPAPAFREKEWKPNGRDALPNLSLDSELDAFKDF
jgi:hypothetical protein